jgi:HSP20 family protein
MKFFIRLIFKNEMIMKNALQIRKTQPGYGIEHVMDGIFNNTLRRFFDGNLWEGDSTTNTGTVPVNVRETENQYEVDVIAPGCRKEDFTIQVKDQQLSISFTHDESKQQTDEKAGWVRNEYVQQSFSRSFTLDNTIDIQKIAATYTNGVLQIILPKNEKAKPLSIAIDVK